MFKSGKQRAAFFAELKKKKDTGQSIQDTKIKPIKVPDIVEDILEEVKPKQIKFGKIKTLFKKK